MKDGHRLEGRDNGGTDMRVGVKFAYEQQLAPHVVVLGTDGYTPWPKQEDIPSGVQFIVVLVGRHCGREGVPSWIPVVVLD